LDELTGSFLHRLLRLRGRLLAVMAAGSLALGFLIPRESLSNIAPVLFLLAAWSVMGWAAADRIGGPMAAVLAAPHARRPWLVAYLVAASLAAGAIAFACVLPNGFRPALIAGLLSLAYGWIVAAIGLCLLLRAGRPRDAHWIGGVVLALAVLARTPAEAGVKGTAWVWHPMMLFKCGLSQALYTPGAAPAASGSLWSLPLYGIAAPLLFSLFAWRWALRTLDRAEIAPFIQ
jgi:hypothetical protein